MAKGGKRPGAGGGKKNKWFELDMPNKMELIEGWARDGATDLEIINALGISHQLFYNWKGKYPELKEALRKGKDIIDIRVENALLKRALGYKFDEITHEPVIVRDPVTHKVLFDDLGEPITELKPVKKVVKEVAPDTTAQIFWLKNRRPDKWRDRKQLDANITTNGFEYLTDEEIEAEIKKLDVND